MKKFIVHLNVFFVTDARDKNEAIAIAEGICASKGFSKRCYKIGQIVEEKSADRQEARIC
jgi:hypothetical protein